MSQRLYKIIPINPYWFGELKAEMIYYHVPRRRFRIEGNTIITGCPEVVDFAIEIFGETLMMVEPVT